MIGSRYMLKPSLAFSLTATLALLLGAQPVSSQDWSPFNPFGKTNDKRKEHEKASPAEADRKRNSITFQPLSEGAGAVERMELAPIMAEDGSGLPFELWRGLDVRTLETLISEIEIPPRSPALHGLWLRLITSNVPPPTGGETDQHFMALRLETLYRSGLLEESSRELSKSQAGNPLVATLAARNEIGMGEKERGCATARSSGPLTGNAPKSLKGLAALISGYCAAIDGDTAGAGLAAELAREEGLRDTGGIAALDAMTTGTRPKIPSGQRISTLDYRLIEAAGGAIETAVLLKHAAPSLLAALALDANTPPALKLSTAEAAAQLNAITPEALARIYRQQAAALQAPSGADPAGLNRAQLFVAAEAERVPLRKVRLIRSFLDESRRAGHYLTALRMIAPESQSIAAIPEVGEYAETGIEVALAAGDYQRAKSWARFGMAVGGPGSGDLSHWLALIDIADSEATSDRGRSLAYIEDLAVRGRLDPILLHRLATVLDALEYNVPIPLWEAASRTPQPPGGFLPETGVLSQLQDAAKKREFGRTVLLTMKTLGANGAKGAHMIALGDSIRALKRAGLEADARKLGFEALFASWPRTFIN
ncbi:MAG: hypothetical protein V3U85_08735 [Hyphomicrobium sp.]